MKVFYAAMAAALISTGAGCTAINAFGPKCGDTCGDVCGPGGCHLAPRQAYRQDCGPCGGDGCAAACGAACGDAMGHCFMGRGEGPCGPCEGGCMQHGLHALLDCNGCGICGAAHGMNHCGRGSDRNYNFTPGPPVGQTAYPYYTVRGPRDFLNPNPRSIGPR